VGRMWNPNKSVSCVAFWPLTPLFINLGLTSDNKHQMIDLLAYKLLGSNTGG
jgi:hypothetical protein